MQKIPHATRIVALILLATTLCAAEDVPLPTPQAFYKYSMADGGLTKYTGENFCWVASYYAHDFLHAYEATGKKDPAWLEQAQVFYDWCIQKGVSDDPDGFPGTIGADESGDNTIVTDSLVGDAILARPILEWAELVQADPALQARFGARAKEYIALATRMCWDKWNKRDCYYQDAHGYGSYHRHPFLIDRADRKKWLPRPSSIISENLNKHYEMGLVFLSLYKLTGKTEYRDRVIAIFSRAKAMFRLFPDEDRVVWNFWMPHGAYDLEGTAPKSWVGLNSAGYQSFETMAFLAVYDAGLVFDRRDIELMVRTNHWMIEHGMKLADGSTNTGCPFYALAPFDEIIQTAVEKASQKNPIAMAYLKQVQLKRNGYDRKDVKDPATVKVSSISVQPGRKLSLAHPIPDSLEIANNERISLLAKVQEAGTLNIELLGANGTTVLGNLATLVVDPKNGSFVAPRWDGTNPKTGKKEPGEYLLRYTLNGEVRTWPVTVKMGTARTDASKPAPLVAGGALNYDFERALDARWSLEGNAAVAEGKAKSGTKALRIGQQSKATLTFGNQDDLPVRVTFAAFDGGAKHGSQGANGQALCLRSAVGDLFAVRQMWRGYMNGDTEVVWVNTGENQWFNPHRAGLGRAPGWNSWSFEFSAGKVVVERDGKRLELAPDRFVPTGAVALVFLGSDAPGDPDLWIDDLTVSYPAAAK